MTEPESLPTEHPWLLAAQAEFGGELEMMHVRGATIADQSVDFGLTGEVLRVLPTGERFRPQTYLAKVAQAALPDVPIHVPRLWRPPPAANDNGEAPEDSTTSGALPDHLCRPPGTTGEIVDFILRSARFPSPPMALSAAVAFMGALVGRRYKGPTGLRSNVYVVALADSGFGKEHSLTAIRTLANATTAGSRFYDKFVVSSPPRSAEGLAARLLHDPSVVIQLDEFGLLLKKWSGRKATATGEAIIAALLELTGKATTSWGGGDKAGGRVDAVFAPCVSVHAVSTPHTFWGALESGDAATGFLPRVTLIDCGSVRPTKQRNPEFDVEQPPSSLVRAIESVAGNAIGGNLMGLAMDGRTRQGTVLAVPWASPEVADYFEEFDDRIVAESSRTDPTYRSLLTRTAATAGQLALIVAVGADPAEPVVTLEIQKWACAVAEHSLRSMLRGADANIADNEKQREYKRVLAVVVSAGKDGITRSDLNRKIRGAFDLGRATAIIQQLKLAGEIVEASVRPVSGQTMHRLWERARAPRVGVRISGKEIVSVLAMQGGEEAG